MTSKGRALAEAKGMLGGLIAIFFVSMFIFPWFAFVAAILICFVLNFFRDPEREISSSREDIVSAADGLVTEVESGVAVPGSAEIGSRVSVFLSIFDVHVNRTPVGGRVLHTEAIKGLFLDARHPQSARKNASRTWIIEEAESGRVVAVRQITGAIARRIIPWAAEGEQMEKGQRIGMIRFGSRTDVFLPHDAQVIVQPGDRVKGGSTVIAKWNPPQ